MIGLFTLRDGMLQIYYKSLRGTEWQHKRTITLPKPNSYWSIVHAAAGYLLLKVSQLDASQFAMQGSQYFTLNLKTFLVEELCVSNNRYTRCIPLCEFLITILTAKYMIWYDTYLLYFLKIWNYSVFYVLLHPTYSRSTFVWCIVSTQFHGSRSPYSSAD